MDWSLIGHMLVTFIIIVAAILGLAIVLLKTL